MLLREVCEDDTVPWIVHSLAISTMTMIFKTFRVVCDVGFERRLVLQCAVLIHIFNGSLLFGQTTFDIILLIRTTFKKIITLYNIV